MSTYDFHTKTVTCRPDEIPQTISDGIDSLGLADRDDLAEIHVLLSGQHGGYDIEFVYAVEDED